MLIDSEREPGATELKWFGLVWLVFFGVLATLALQTEQALRVLAAVSTLCLLLAGLFNRELRWSALAWGLLIPAFLWTLVGACELSGAGAIRWWHAQPGHPRWWIAIAVLSTGVFGMLGILLERRLAAVLYRRWMQAALPLGWSFSALLLALAYYLVLTPLGWLRRTLGGDPLARRFEPGRTSYWIAHPGPRAREGYFRQF